MLLLLRLNRLFDFLKVSVLLYSNELWRRSSSAFDALLASIAAFSWASSRLWFSLLLASTSFRRSFSFFSFSLSAAFRSLSSFGGWNLDCMLLLVRLRGVEDEVGLDGIGGTGGVGDTGEAGATAGSGCSGAE